MIESDPSPSAQSDIEWSDVDGGFAFVRNQIIIPVDDLPAPAVGEDEEEARRQDVSRTLGELLARVRETADTGNDSTNEETGRDETARDETDADLIERAAAAIVNVPKPTVDEKVKALLAQYGVAGVVTELVNDGRFVLVRGTIDVVNLVSALRARGIAAQPNHAFFLHDECCCSPHPATPWAASGLLAVLAGAISGQPLSGIKGRPLSGIKGRPLSGIKGRPLSGIKGRGSSISPVAGPPPGPGPATLDWGNRPQPTVVILDTGMPNQPNQPNQQNSQFLTYTKGVPGEETDSGDNPPPVPPGTPPPHPSADGFLDEAGGHGGFIASLIERFAPGTNIQLRYVLHPQSNEIVKETTVCAQIEQATVAFKKPGSTADLIISMSFGGTVWTHAGQLADAVTAARQMGVVFVASAGNEAACTPLYPAALPGVVSVGAIGPEGPADFTNYGPWVRCCAPGVDLVGRFFTHDYEAANTMSGDPDEFKGWAMWSGTSFAVPMVVAALVRDMANNNHTAQEAVEAVIDAPHLGRIPGLGTVVNI